VSDRRGLTLDAGALLAYGRGDDRVRAFLRIAATHRRPVVVPAPVLTQVWRDGRRQVWLSRLLREVDVLPVDRTLARRAGEALGRAELSDAVDATVAVIAATRGHAVLTSDPQDLGCLAAVLGGFSIHVV